MPMIVKNSVGLYLGKKDKERVIGSTYDHQNFDGATAVGSVKDLYTTVDNCIVATLVLSDVAQRHRLLAGIFRIANLAISVCVRERQRCVCLEPLLKLVFFGEII